MPAIVDLRTISFRAYNQEDEISISPFGYTPIENTIILTGIKFRAFNYYLLPENIASPTISGTEMLNNQLFANLGEWI